MGIHAPARGAAAGGDGQPASAFSCAPAGARCGRRPHLAVRQGRRGLHGVLRPGLRPVPHPTHRGVHQQRDRRGDPGRTAPPGRLAADRRGRLPGLRRPGHHHLGRPARRGRHGLARRADRRAELDPDRGARIRPDRAVPDPRGHRPVDRRLAVHLGAGGGPGAAVCRRAVETDLAGPRGPRAGGPPGAGERLPEDPPQVAVGIRDVSVGGLGTTLAEMAVASGVGFNVARIAGDGDRGGRVGSHLGELSRASAPICSRRTSG